MPNKPQKVNLTSANLTEEKLAELYRILPETFAENKIDWDKLRTILGDSIETGPEKFNFTWAGKSKAVKNVVIPSRQTLVPAQKESVDWDNTGNLFIEGDNLEVLKLLQKAYFEKVKMIYIDPPYNTGNDFVYNDDFKTDALTHAQLSGEAATTGDWLVTNPITNGRYHSDWLSMMYPRMKMAWNLLSNDGLIFVSIDDNEVHRLRMLLDEVFGEENFLGCAARVAKKSNNKGDFWAPNFDYILTYAKNKGNTLPFFGGVNYEAYDQVDTEGPRKGEKYQLVRLFMSTIENRNPEQRFWIECPDGTKVIPPGSTLPPERPILGDGIWRWTRKKFEEEKDRIVVKKVRSSNLIDENGNPAKWNVFTKTYLNDVINNASAKPNSLIEDQINQIGSHELNRLEIPFDYPKPSTLIQYLIEISRIKDDAIVLDFFAGSGTTAHAVMAQNAKDGGKRKWICVQLPEETDPKSEAFNQGYKTISDIAKERIKRSSKLVKEVNENAHPFDEGFKVLKLSKSNYPENLFEFDPSKTSEDQKQAFDSFLKVAKQQGLFDTVNEEGIVFENIIKEGFSPNSIITKQKLGNSQSYRVTDEEKQMLLCLDKKLSSDTLDQLTSPEYKGKLFICLDNALDDSAKANLALNVELKTV